MLVVIDVQERLCNAMPTFSGTCPAMVRAIRIAGLLGVDILVTEQYPKGLGVTVQEIRECLPQDTPVFTKTSFSCWGTKSFAAAVDAVRPQALVLVGMETHVCVQQTAVDALQRGYSVIVLADAVCSRREGDRATAVAYMTAQGAKVTTVEALGFDWLGDAQHPRFRELSKIVK